MYRIYTTDKSLSVCVTGKTAVANDAANSSCV
jgi:hypothetical protein